MTEPSFLETIRERGFLHQCTDAPGLASLLEGPSVPAYIGFDCTADSLHVGSLVSIMLLRRYQQAGHKPIVLLGGGTTKVGDPSGKEEARPLLSDEQIAANMAGIRRVFEKFLTFGDGPSDAVMVNNADWLDSLSYIPFLREYGRYFSVNRMLSMDSVRLRLDRAAAVELPRVQLCGAAVLRLRRTGAPRRLPAADGRIGPVGQYR